MKQKTRKIIAGSVVAFVLVALTCLFAAGCGSSAVLTITENNKQYSTYGYGYVSVEVPETATNYNVSVNTGEGSETNKSRVEVIENIRPTVVDVYGYAANGTSAGSGVIVYSESTTDADALPDYYFVVTNHHVIDECSTFSVSLLFIDEETDEETYGNYSADLIGSSPSRDIAVLRIERKADEVIKTATVIENSDSVKVGTDVIAIGNPLGILGGTVTMGIVSATARTVTVEDVGSMTLMQTDAAINSGNSGGGLFDTNGNLVGIVNSGYSSYEGLNFAIPLNDARFAANSLIETYRESDGNVTQYGYVEGDTELGISCRTMTNIYESSSSNVSGSYVIASANSTSSLLYNAWGQNYQAIISVKITKDGSPTDYAVSNMTYMESAMKTVKAGDTVEFTYRSVMIERGFMGMTKYYLGSETQTASVTATQYVYSIN